LEQAKRLGKSTDNFESRESKMLCACADYDMSANDVEQCVLQGGMCNDDGATTATDREKCDRWTKWVARQERNVSAELSASANCDALGTRLAEKLRKYSPNFDDFTAIRADTTPDLCNCASGMSAEQRRSCKSLEWPCLSPENQDTAVCRLWSAYTTTKLEKAQQLLSCSDDNIKTTLQKVVELLPESEKNDAAKVVDVANEALCKCFYFHEKDDEDKCFDKDASWRCNDEQSTDAVCLAWSEHKKKHLAAVG